MTERHGRYTSGRREAFSAATVLWVVSGWPARLLSVTRTQTVLLSWSLLSFVPAPINKPSHTVRQRHIAQCVQNKPARYVKFECGWEKLAGFLINLRHGAGPKDSEEATYPGSDRQLEDDALQASVVDFGHTSFGNAATSAYCTNEDSL